MNKIFKMMFMILGSVVFLLGCSKLANENSGKSTYKEAADKKIINIENIENISFREMSSNIKIYYHDEKDILIKNSNVDDFSYKTKDKVLEIISEKNTNTGDYTVFLPRKYYNEIKIANKSATTKIFDINCFTLEIHSNNEVIVDNAKIDYLRVWTEDNKVVLTKSIFKDMNTSTTNNGNVIVDKVQVDEAALLKTRDGDILANFVGNKNDYKILQDYDVENKYNKKIITITIKGKVDLKFI